MKTVTLVINKSGQVAMETRGFDGQSCKDATKALELGLGVVLSDKPHYDQPIQITSAEVNQ